MEKVFGVGWAKTGTTSLGRAFELLGYSHARTRLDIVESLIEGDETALWETVERFDSFEDWPWTLFYEQFYDRYPHAKFILTTRSEDRWIKSYRGMLDRDMRKRRNIDAIRRYIYGFDTETADDATLIQRVRAHNDAVARFFSDKPGSLLTIDWERGDGWEKLCGFLGKPVPADPFPHEKNAAKTSRTRTLAKKAFNRLKSVLRT